MANEKRLDLIDRKDLLKALENADADICETYPDCYCEWGFSRQALEDLLQNITTVDAVPVVHGHWEDGYGVDHSGKKVYDSIDCSVCEEVFKIESHDREYWKERFKFCPFCGSQMMDGDGNG